MTNKNQFIAFVLFLFISSYSYASQLQGIVSDLDTGEPLIGVNISDGNGQGTVTDVDGKYVLNLAEGNYQLSFNYLGYIQVTKQVKLLENESKTLNISLQEEVKMTDEVVISSSVFGKRASEEVISIEVVTPKTISKINPIKFDDIARRVTGLNVINGQANIRGGSGWSYGVGSRVMVIVDGQPILSPDKFDVKWDFLPTESIERIEVLKGASSVLYGSSAMNGTINIQTIKPTSTPINKLTAYTAVIGKPQRREIKWWRAPRMATGVSFSRAHKVSDKFEYVVGANLASTALQFKDITEQSARVNFNLKWNKGENLSWGVKGNFMRDYEEEVFWWTDAGAGALKPGQSDDLENIRITIDPFITKYSKNGVKHDFKNRLYITKIEYSKKPIYMINNDYQVSKKLLNGWSAIGGLSAMTLFVNDKGSFGEPLSANFFAAFGQVEKKWDKFTAVLGSRGEMFRVQKKVGLAAAPLYNKNDKQVFVSPGNWRFGFNYNPFNNSFFRLNFGQGFRFPSMAERYATASVGNVSIYPNKDLRPEYGWTGELGFQQKFQTKSRKFSGSFDLAFFWQEYNDLVEFLFDVYVPDSILNSGQSYQPFDYVGFSSINISKARIGGYEVTWNNTVKTDRGHQFNLSFGYSYSYPVELNEIEGGGKQVGSYVKNLFKANFKKASAMENSELMESVLKYRNRHLVTADAEWSFKRFTLGADVRYYSFMEKVDAIFELYIKDLRQYRIDQNFKGDWIFGARGFYNINSKHTIGLIVKNASNREYYQRPPKLESPINYTLQYRFEF
ncbi:MAG: TonB-dependent receptor [Chitinophagales bacterium]|nr:TonB-dependent receptor [Chitinophagales bacterium]